MLDITRNFDSLRSPEEKSLSSPPLNSAQEAAVHAPHEPLLIVAGAGTGKTKTLTTRLRYFLAQGIPGDHICALTFTNKAAREMEERVTPRLQSYTHKPPYIGTFHSLGARILRKEARRLGRTPSFVIYDDRDAHDAIKRAMGIPKKTRIAKHDPSSPVALLKNISKIKNGIIDRQSLLASDSRDAMLLHALLRYETTLKEMNAFDFDDLIEKVVFLFESFPEVRKRYAARAEYLLVDEYQDLNNMQYRLVQLLAKDSRNVSVVGDDQQMIYTFRGSNFDIFLNFEKDWHPARVVFLEENYRSTSTIIAAAQAVISHNREQKQKHLWTKNDAGRLIRIVATAHEDDEAAWIAEQMELGIKDHELTAVTNADSVIHNSKFIIPGTAVLYRTNAQSRAIEQAFIEHDIPYHIFGGITFYERREIKDIIAALRVAINPRDEVSRDRLHKTFRKAEYLNLITILRDHAEETPAELIARVIRATDYLHYLERNVPNPEERTENIRELVAYAHQFVDIASFLERVSLLQATDHLRGEQGGKGEKNTVHLMSIHLAKGLEFDRVFLIGATEGVLPHARSLDTERGLEEERRLMYVAMTRARKELIISYYDVPSRFVEEIPEAFTEHIRTEIRDETSEYWKENYITLE